MKRYRWNKVTFFCNMAVAFGTAAVLVLMAALMLGMMGFRF